MPLTQLLPSGGTPFSPPPPPPLPTFGAFGRVRWPGRFPTQGARLAAPSAPGGCLAPPPPPRDAGSRRQRLGAAGSPGPGSAAPSRRGLPCGVLLLPPRPSPWLSPARSGGCGGPWMASDRQRGFSPGGSIQVRLKRCHLALFSKAKSVGLALRSVGMSLSRRSCLHLGTPLKNYVCVDLPQRGRQQAKHWDRNPASVQFGYFLDF